MSASPEIRAFFDEPTNTVTYLVWDARTRQAAVIDPVLDYDPATGEADTRSVQAVLAEADRLGLQVVWALDTVHDIPLHRPEWLAEQLLAFAAEL